MGSGKRGRSKDPVGVLMVSTLREKFPKFTGVQLSMTKNPAYGLQLSSEAQAMLRDKGIPLPNKKPRRKHLNNSDNRKRKSFRLTSEQEVRFSELMKRNNCKTVQELIEKIIKENEL